MVSRADEIYIAVKNDDVREFSRIVGGRRSLLALCYGRFPLLSVCYLFNSRKIIAKYEKQMLNVGEYTFTDEYEGIYKEFRKYAGKSLRLYIYSDNLVEPQQMLAILGKDDKLSYISRKFPLSQANAQTVERIYNINDSINTKTLDNGSIAVDNRKLSSSQKFIVAVSLLLVTLIVTFAVCAGVITNQRFGGAGASIDDSILISTQTQLNTALTDRRYDGKYFTLNSDFTLSEDWQLTDFAGHINGNGHTLYIKKSDFGGLFGTLAGSLNNINIVIAEQRGILSDDFALIALVNNGTISNLRLTVEGESEYTERCEDSEGKYFGLITAHNRGTVSNCIVSASVSVSGDAIGDYYMSAIVGLNGLIVRDTEGNATSIVSGVIRGCTVAEQSVLDTHNVDVGGIAAASCTGSTIENCTNNASIRQVSDSEGWTPNSAGIVCANAGTVSGCVNNGSVSASSTVTNADATVNAAVYVSGIACTNESIVADCRNYGAISASAENTFRHRTVFSAGIVVINYGTVRTSRNDAAVSGHSSDFYVYSGGVVAQNNSTTQSTGTIASCGSMGSVSASSDGAMDTSTYVFAGGVCGANFSAVLNCFSGAEIRVSVVKSEVTEGNTAQNYGYAGGINGLTDYNSSIQNSYFLSQSGVSYGSAAVLLNNSIVGYTNSGTKAVATLEELMSSGVYWE